MQGSAHYPQLFATHTLPHLLTKQFTPNPEQLQFAKFSLIQKHKAATGIQQLLFCRKTNKEELLTMNEKTMMENQRKKYLDYVRKNYNEKITDELTSLNKLKGRIKQFQAKGQEERRQELEEKDGKNMAQQELAKKRRKNEEIKATVGKKKVKTEEQPKKATKSKKPKVINEPMQQELAILAPEDRKLSPQHLPQHEDHHSQSLNLDLLNSLSQDDFDNYQDDDE